MRCLVQRSLCLVALAVFVTTCPAHAKPFDLIYADRIDVRLNHLPPLPTGFSHNKDIGIVVNTGTSEVTASELAGATFTTSCSDPSVVAVVWIDDAGLGGPIVPNEAVGSVGCVGGSVLPWLLLPGEILRSMYPTGVMYLWMAFPEDFFGMVVVDVTMTMGTDIAHYLVTVNFSGGEEFGVSVPHATRVRSSVVTAAGTSFWGGIELACVGNPGTVAFELVLPDAADVEVTLYDMAGRRVATLSNGPLPAGRHTLSVPDRNRLASGMYFARAAVRTPGRSVERVAKAIVVR